MIDESNLQKTTNKSFSFNFLIFSIVFSVIFVGFAAYILHNRYLTQKKNRRVTAGRHNNDMSYSQLATECEINLN